MRNAQIGTISHGTLRDEDLLEAFSSELRSLTDNTAHIKLCDDADAMLARMNEDEDVEPTEDNDPEYASDLVNELSDALNEYAPDFCYFGSNEGDGSDFGFWPSMDAIEEAIHDETAVRVESVPDYIVQVSDHGNVTVYRVVKVKEIWACV